MYTYLSQYLNYDFSTYALPKNLNKCFILLGHEIDQETFDLSLSSKKRCEKLAERILHVDSKDYMIIFMGQGRLQGNCKLTISECMFQYFSENYFRPANIFLDKKSKDTVGDAIFSFEIISNLGFYGNVEVITSDWHSARTSMVFNSIYNNKYDLKIVECNEINNLTDLEIANKKKSENKSLQAFKDFYSNYDQEKFNYIQYLSLSHRLYKFN